MSEELKQAIEAAKEQIQHTIEQNNREDLASWEYEEGCLISRKHMKALLAAIPGPDVIRLEGPNTGKTLEELIDSSIELADVVNPGFDRILNLVRHLNDIKEIAKIQFEEMRMMQAQLKAAIKEADFIIADLLKLLDDIDDAAERQLLYEFLDDAEVTTEYRQKMVRLREIFNSGTEPTP